MILDPRLFGERSELYGVDLLDGTENFITTLPVDAGDGTGVSAGVTSGSISFNLDSTIMASCQLSIVNPGDLIDWMSHRFRPWIQVNGTDELRWNLGIYVPASPNLKHLSTGGIQADATCGDKTTLLDRTSLPNTLAIAAGATVTAWVDQLIFTAAGDNITGVVPSDKTLAAAMTWPPGTHYLQIVNDLLGSIAYNNVWCDLDGLFRSEEWVDPADQAPDVVFAEGVSAIHSGDFDETQDTVAVPNRVTCVTQGDDTNPGLISVVTNEDPNSPYSFQSRDGYWIDAFYSGVEASDQATLDKIAAKNMKLNTTPPWYADVTHATVPLVGRQVLQFTSDGIDRQVSVNEWGITMTPGALMTGKWLGVAS